MDYQPHSITGTAVAVSDSRLVAGANFVQHVESGFPSVVHIPVTLESRNSYQVEGHLGFVTPFCERDRYPRCGINRITRLSPGEDQPLRLAAPPVGSARG